MTDYDRAEIVRSQLMYDANRKSAGVAYLLLIFLGGLGAHRFYLGKTGSALAQLAMSIFGWLTLAVFVGVLLLIPLGIWLIVDLFLIPGIVRGQNTRLANDLTGGLPA